MRLLTFATENGSRLGLLKDDGKTVIDLAAAVAALKLPALPPEMVGFIEAGDRALKQAETVLARSLPSTCLLLLSDLKIKAPIERPRKNVYCVGLNYVAHNKEFQGAQKPLPEHPIVFTKPPMTVVGPGDSVNAYPHITSELDYEAELGVVIGKRGRDIKAHEVPSHIFGYTCINDITARDLQRKHAQWFIGKSLDGFCPIGPSILVRDGCAWPPALRIESRVNGEVRQSSTTDQLIFDITRLIVTLSAGHTLEPGDILATGTPAGVGMSFDPPRFMHRGDVVEVEIEKIGILRNVIV